MRKRIKFVMAVVMALVVCICSNTDIIHAESTNAYNMSDETDVLGNFLTHCYGAPDYAVIMDANGNDITELFLGQVKDLYVEKDFDAIRELICENDYSLKYTEEFQEEVHTRDVQPRAFLRKTVSDVYYVIETASNAGYTKEWLMRLTGTFTYNANTFEVTNASAPTLSIEVASFGALFSPYITNVSTNYQISKYSVTFTGTYKMMATLGTSEGNIWITRDYDFGTHTHTLVGKPD